MQALKIIGMSMVGGGEGDKWLKPFLQRMREIVDDIAVCFNDVDEKTERITRKFTSKIYRDDREWGKLQPIMKTDFLKKVVWDLKPHWILWLDADEFPEPAFTRQKAREWALKPYDVAYTFWFVQLWDKEDCYLPNYAFEDTRFFKVLPEYGLEVKKTPLHCGNYPEVVAQRATHSNFYIKHYGLLKREDREEKYRRYQKYDPKGLYMPQWFYDGYINPNPPIQSFREEEFKPQLGEMQFKIKNPMPTAKKQDPNTPKKYWRWLNSHGNLIIFDEEKYHLQRWYDGSRNRGWQFLGEYTEQESEFPVFNATSTPTSQPEVVDDPLECKVCGYIGKNKKALAMHQRVKKHIVSAS